MVGYRKTPAFLLLFLSWDTKKNIIVMEYRTMLRFQKWLYFNVYIYVLWVIVIASFLYHKLHSLGHLSKYLSATVFVLVTGLESIRLYLGHYGNLSCRVPELAGFLMLTTLMQMPLLSFFLFNPYLMSTPTEIILHLSLWSVALVEVILGYLALKQASSVAKSIYFSHSKGR